MIQPSRVLPSNASPLNHNEDFASRVLREHSGNRQYNPYGQIQPLEQKYRPSSSTESGYALHQPVQQPQHAYRQTPLQRHNYRYGRPGYYGHQTDTARNEKMARYLFHRFRSSEQYMKYREKQAKGDKKEEQKWPDRLELAFFQALIQWPPMGRRKLPLKDKLRGRNELIADYIQELTGESRTRKQVSSHIQVLKPFVEHDSFIMKWLSRDLSKTDQTRFFGRSLSYYDGSRGISTYPATSVPPVTRSQAPVLSPSIMQEISKAKHSLDIFEPTDFSMFVQRKYRDETDVEHTERLHTYTSSITQPLQPTQHISNWQSLQQEFPLLHSLHQRRPFDCNTLLAEASLGFPDSNFRDDNGMHLPGVEVGISFLCSSRHLPVHAAVKCQSRFYKDGQLLNQGLTDIRLAQSEDANIVETQLRFGSSFWAKTLATLALRLTSDTDPVKAREEVTHHIKGITAMQEIYLMNDPRPERLLIIHWRFRLSKVKQGRAYWMRAVLPNTPEHADQKSEHVDSVYDYALNFADPAMIASSTTMTQIQTSQPALQSPFEYDNSTNSALTSATTWPDSILDEGPHTAIDWNGGDANPFDFANATAAAQATDMTYDPNLDFTTFDSSAFNFDAAADFADDPMLEDFTHDLQGFGQHPHQLQQHGADYSWCEGYDTAFGGEEPVGQQSVSGASSAYAVLPVDPQAQEFEAYGQYDHTYHGATDDQAYGGAGVEGNGKDDALAALEGGNYLAKVSGLSGAEHQSQ